MNRKSILCLLVSCLLVWLASGSGFAQEAAQKEAGKKPPPQAGKTKAKGVQVVKVQNPTGFSYPEIRYLQLPMKEFAAFEADPKGYLNALHPFPNNVDVNVVYIVHMPPPGTTKVAPTEMGLACVHDQGSSCTCVTSPAQ